MAHDEKLYFNGDIYTLDERAPSVEAVAVRDGLILATGAVTIAPPTSPRAEPVDLKGPRCFPGSSTPTCTRYS